MDFFKQDLSYKLVDDVKGILDKEKQDYKLDGKKEEKIAIAKKLLNLNLDIETIIQATGLTEKEIEKLK